MDSDEGKLFIGGISWDTTAEMLNDHFSQYGVVSQTQVMHDKLTKRPRGFAFVVFADPSLLDQVLQLPHTIDGRIVDVKKALSREEQRVSSSSGNHNSNRSYGGYFRTNKIFVGGLPASLSEEDFRAYFESYGHVTDVVVMYDQSTNRPRGFGFITFGSEDAVDKVLEKNFHDLSGKQVEVKRALPKDGNSGARSRGVSYQGYGATANVVDVRTDGTRFTQPQNSTAGLPPYSGYATPLYGYGAANAGVGYAGYMTTSFGGPAGVYGNPNGPNAGYLVGGPGALKLAWGNLSPSGYGASAAYGPIAAPLLQPPSGSTVYGNQGYGYANYSVGSLPHSGIYGIYSANAASAPNGGLRSGGYAGSNGN